MRRSIAALPLVAALLAPRAAAQQVVATAPDTVVVPTDTVARLRPLSAAWRSLLLPGWGQAATGRSVTGALFVVWEGTTLYMWAKARAEAEYFEEIGAPTGGKRQEEEDWLVLLVFNHLFAAAEAFVAAHLQDFPEELKIRAVPGGVGVRLPLPR
jgi:hypothetical protein